jgi:hypothetical protein
MFYARVNKIKVFNNHEGFLGLFNRAELQIYSLVSNPTNMAGFWHIGDRSGQPKVMPAPILLKTKDLIDLNDKRRKEKLLEATLTEVERFSQSQSIEINRVRDRQNTPDTTGNILVDYTLFGFEADVFSKPEEKGNPEDFIPSREEVKLK